MNVQIIKQKDGGKLAVMPYEEFVRLRDQAELLEDLKALDRALKEQDETLPIEMVDRLLEGEHPIRVWRDHRGMTAAALATAVGVSKSAISQYENYAKTPTVATLAAMARALETDLDDLVPTRPPGAE